MTVSRATNPRARARDMFANAYKDQHPLLLHLLLLPLRVAVFHYVCRTVQMPGFNGTYRVVAYEIGA